jgi:Nitrile hydratase beta subunit
LGPRKSEHDSIWSNPGRHCEPQGVERRPSFRTGYGEAIHGNVGRPTTPGSPRRFAPRDDGSFQAHLVPGAGFLKAKDGEPAFGEAWHAQTLALADLLVKRGVVSPTRWAETLGAEIEALKAGPDDRETYFRAVLAGLERVLAEIGGVTRAELDAREQQWERAYLATPHGKPVELAAGAEED